MLNGILDLLSDCEVYLLNLLVPIDMEAAVGEKEFGGSFNE